MWFLLWFLFSVFILGVFAWSFRTLVRQKQAWKTFAQKNNLTYRNGVSMLASPIITGQMNGYTFNLFSVQMPADDGRSMRFNMVMEFSLHRGLPTFGAVFTPRAAILLEGQDMPYSADIDGDPEWDPSWKIRAKNTSMVKQYLTPERRQILTKLFRMKIVSGMLAFNAEDMVLRLETADPLDNLERLEKIVRSVMSQLEPLKTTSEEYESLR